MRRARADKRWRWLGKESHSTLATEQTDDKAYSSKIPQGNFRYDFDYYLLLLQHDKAFRRMCYRAAIGDSRLCYSRINMRAITRPNAKYNRRIRLVYLAKIPNAQTTMDPVGSIVVSSTLRKRAVPFARRPITWQRLCARQRRLRRAFQRPWPMPWLCRRSHRRSSSGLFRQP